MLKVNIYNKKFFISFAYFSTIADDDEVYILSGQKNQEWNDETNRWDFDEPSKYVLKTDHPDILNNLIQNKRKYYY